MGTEVGKRVRNLRVEKGLTQQEIANMLEIERGNYSKYELGKLEFNNEMLVKLSKYYKVTTDYILGLENYE